MDNSPNAINLPTPEAPAEIRESFRAVLRSHMFVVVRAFAASALDLNSIELSPSVASRDQDGGDRVDELQHFVRVLIEELRAWRRATLAVDDFESLLVELGNNAMQRLHMLAINAQLDAEESTGAAPVGVLESAGLAGLSSMVRDYLAASDAFDADTIGTRTFRRRGIAVAEARERLRKAVSSEPTERRVPPKVKPDDIKWSDAEHAATLLAKLCRDIGFVAPEGWQSMLHDAAGLMDDITKALHLTRPTIDAPDAERSVLIDICKDNGTHDWAPHLEDLRVQISRLQWPRAIWTCTRLIREATRRWHEDGAVST